MAEAVFSRLTAWASVRAYRSWPPWAMPSAEPMKPAISERTSPTTARRLTWICCKLRANGRKEGANCSLWSWVVRLQAAMSRANCPASHIPRTMRVWNQASTPAMPANIKPSSAAQASAPCHPSQRGTMPTMSTPSSISARFCVAEMPCTRCHRPRSPGYTTRPWCKRRVWRCAAWSARNCAYNASACCTSARPGLVRTDI